MNTSALPTSPAPNPQSPRTFSRANGELGVLLLEGVHESAVQVFEDAQFGTYRLLHIHRNQPGVLAAINAVFSESGTNISGEHLQTDDKQRP